MAALSGWTPQELPRLDDKTYLITGGNTGLGLESTKILTGKGARVLFTSRSVEKGEAARQQVLAEVPDAQVDVVPLDLTDPASIEQAVKEVVRETSTLDAVINNAGVMQTPQVRTAEGFELQFATNHLGHFRLNSALLPLIEASAGRFVIVSSFVHRMGQINFDDLMSRQSYDPSRAYGQSKLANLMYALHLHRVLQERGSSATAYAAHPGYSATDLQSSGVGMEGGSKVLRRIYPMLNRFVAQPATLGAYPQVMAAADNRVVPGTYYGPTGLMEARGPVGEAKIAPQARDAEAQQQLWDVTENLVGAFVS